MNNPLVLATLAVIMNATTVFGVTSYTATEQFVRNLVAAESNRTDKAIYNLRQDIQDARYLTPDAIVAGDNVRVDTNAEGIVTISANVGGSIIIDNTIEDGSTNAVSGGAVYTAVTNLEQIALTSAKEATNGLASVAFTGAYEDLSGRPAKLSEFENDEGFVTDSITNDVSDRLEKTSNALVFVSNSVENVDARLSSIEETYTNDGYTVRITAPDVTIAATEERVTIYGGVAYTGCLIDRNGGDSYVKENGEILDRVRKDTPAYAAGSSTAAYGRYSHAEGASTLSEGLASHAEGLRTITGEDASYAHADGYHAIASNTLAYVWAGSTMQEIAASYPYYGSHGEGTFNLNPVGGLLGFWIGETNLFDHIAAVSQLSDDYTTNNTVLVSTIESIAPLPSDYATVSNKAMNAVADTLQTLTNSMDMIDLISDYGIVSGASNIIAQIVFNGYLGTNRTTVVYDNTAATSNCWKWSIYSGSGFELIAEGNVEGFSPLTDRSMTITLTGEASEIYGTDTISFAVGVSSETTTGVVRYSDLTTVVYDSDTDWMSLYFKGQTRARYYPNSNQVQRIVANAINNVPTDINYLAVSNAAMNALSRAEAKAGFTEWTILRNGEDVTTQVAQLRWDDTEAAWSTQSACVSGDYSNQPYPSWSSRDDTNVVWSAWYALPDESQIIVDYTATRTRLPTMADIAAATNGIPRITESEENPGRAAFADVAGKAVLADISQEAEKLASLSEVRSGDAIFAQLDAATETNAQQNAAIDAVAQSGTNYTDSATNGLVTALQTHPASGGIPVSYASNADSADSADFAEQANFAGSANIASSLGSAISSRSADIVFAQLDAATATNAAQTAAIDAVPSTVTNIVRAIAPVPGDYAAVSNAAMNALSMADSTNVVGSIVTNTVHMWRKVTQSEWDMRGNPVYEGNDTWRADFERDSGDIGPAYANGPEDATLLRFRDNEIDVSYERCVYNALGLARLSDMPDATLTPVYSDTPTFSEWTFSIPGDYSVTEAYDTTTEPEDPFWQYILYHEGTGIGGTGFPDRMTEIDWGDYVAGLISTRTRTDIVGYTLGSQTDKVLASTNLQTGVSAETVTNIVTNIVADTEAKIDYTESNAVLTNTIIKIIMQHIRVEGNTLIFAY